MADDQTHEKDTVARHGSGLLKPQDVLSMLPLAQALKPIQEWILGPRRFEWAGRSEFGLIFLAEHESS